MKPSLDSDEEEELGALQKTLRERANRSIQHLSSMLGGHSSDSTESNEHQEMLSTPLQNPCMPVQQSEAANQLRSLLQKQSKDANVQSPLSSKRKLVAKQRATDEGSSILPGVHDLVPIIHNQSEYIQHLEAEVKFCKEELLGLKQRVRVVVVENEKLHQELKAKTLEDTLKEYTLVDSTLNMEPTPEKTPKPRLSSFNQAEHHKWKKEMEQLKCLYQAQTETLEAQVVSLKKDLASIQKEYEDMKERLRHKEAMAVAAGSGQRVGGLCLKCAQHEAVLAETHYNVHVQTIERLTKERDELMIVLCSLRASQTEAQQREWAAYQQVKQAVEMAEEANLEKTRALVQCEHFHSELTRQRERLERELASKQDKITQAREASRAESKKEKEELAKTVTSLSQRVAELEGLLERGERDRNSLNGQLEEAYKKLTAQEADNSRVCAELRFLLSQAQLKKEEAEREVRDISSKLGHQLELVEQEVQKLGVELSSCRQRLEEAQRAEGRARAEAAGLAEGLSCAQRQLHLTRQEKEAVERCCGEDMAALTFQAQQREHELTQTLQQMEAQHERSVRETDTLLSAQNILIGKLKEECHTLGAKLEELAQSSRAEIEQLSLEREHLQESTEKLRSRCEEMEEQCVQHGRMHQRMKQRLQQLDQHGQASSQQVMELLSRQNQLMQERQQLAEEMQNLKVQLHGEQRVDVLAM
ncbi:serologically defined colon cancer antigen 8 homolog isoform X1 [Myxocyprinus asiaticus]|uniref:serologically defined colon cancer antigen 8 homolog isoform X1 n=1 Tax=Myxocyprinus asiaticus TaxID=70543 RepID=UPI002222DF98|nr:serologically defined colon cancer antigen 8 homolog isoform X1 [Myxocyprinus asiaticus]